MQMCIFSRGVGGLPAQISGSTVLVVQVPKIFVVGRRVRQPMTGEKVLISEAKRRRDVVIVLSSKLSPQSFPEEPGEGELTMYGAHSTRQETTIWLTFPDANKIIIGQPDLKYHKIERTGSDNQKRSPSNILPSSQINQNQVPITLHW